MGPIIVIRLREMDKMPAADDGLFPIRTWSQTDCSSTPWIVADQKGFLAEEGLKVVYTGDTQPAQQIPSVMNGNNGAGGGTHPKFTCSSY